MFSNGSSSSHDSNPSNQKKKPKELITHHTSQASAAHVWMHMATMKWEQMVKKAIIRYGNTTDEDASEGSSGNNNTADINGSGQEVGESDTTQGKGSGQELNASKVMNGNATSAPTMIVK